MKKMIGTLLTALLTTSSLAYAQATFPLKSHTGTEALTAFPAMPLGPEAGMCQCQTEDDTFNDNINDREHASNLALLPSQAVQAPTQQLGSPAQGVDSKPGP